MNENCQPLIAFMTPLGSLRTNRDTLRPLQCPSRIVEIHGKQSERLARRNMNPVS